MSGKINIKMQIHNIFQTVHQWMLKHRFAEFLILAIAIVFFSEILNQRSIVKAAQFMVFSFPAAALNVSIVLSTLAISLLTHKKIFWKYFITAFWVIISIVSCVMYSFRLMPFSFMDILLLPSTFTVLPVYLAIWQMILIGIGVAGAIVLIVWLYRKSPSSEVAYRKSAVCFLLSVVFTVVYLLVCRQAGYVDNRITGLTFKYRTNGFVYCFSSSLVDMGMNEPKEYSDTKIENVMSEINDYDADEKTEANVIFVQLESFFDINSVEPVGLSENPLPVFTRLKKEFSHGFLNVPTYSAGTANTEFEILTGMNTDYFGIGEFPFQTVAEKQVIESIAHIMTSNGYKNHALHNNSAKFYNRDKVYSNLGFNTFTSLEYMYDVKYNSMGWATDMSLLPAITDAISSTKEKDFIYAVGVQTHGVYPDKIDESALKIKVTGIEDEKTRNQYAYYVNELKQVDTFIGTLVSELEVISEPTVLVVFGDHLPGIEPEVNINTAVDDVYKTEYLLWSNFETDCIIKDLESYQLYSYVLDRLNFEGGAVHKLHRKYSFSEKEEYLENFEILQYHMLYETSTERKEDKPLYEPTELKLGIRNISVSHVNFVADVMYVHGNNFNEFSKIFVDNKELETVYIDKHTLYVAGFECEGNPEIKVCQKDANSGVLSETESIKVY